MTATTKRSDKFGNSALLFSECGLGIAARSMAQGRFAQQIGDASPGLLRSVPRGDINFCSLPLALSVGNMPS
jgi:hypothetical protein